MNPRFTDKREKLETNGSSGVEGLDSGVRASGSAGDDDAGLKIDLERTILNRWRQEQEDAPSPFPVMPAAAVP